MASTVESSAVQMAPQTCPLSRALRAVGDRWTLLILRDMMLDGPRSYGEILRRNPEGIATNILVKRLKTMVADGLLTRAAPEPGGRQPYALTAAAIALLPVIAELGVWGLEARAPCPFDLRARLLFGGGPRYWKALARELEAEHLQARPGRAVRDRLELACSNALSGRGPIALDDRPETAPIA